MCASIDIPLHGCQLLNENRVIVMERFSLLISGKRRITTTMMTDRDPVLLWVLCLKARLWKNILAGIVRTITFVSWVSILLESWLPMWTSVPQRGSSDEKLAYCSELPLYGTLKIQTGPADGRRFICLQSMRPSHLNKEPYSEGRNTSAIAFTSIPQTWTMSLLIQVYFCLVVIYMDQQ